jgi:hypothetical protein
MLIAFKIILMVVAFILSLGAIGEEKEHLRRDIQYILVIDLLILAALFIFVD